MDALDKLKEIYGEGCWMGYKLANDNPYTFHHIRKKCNGGRKSMNNGAVLTLHAHRDLNEIEKAIPPYYRELNRLFSELNKSKMPPTLEYYREVNRILKKVQKKIDLSKYCEIKSEITIYLPSFIEDIFKEDAPKTKKRGSIDLFR